MNKLFKWEWSLLRTHEELNVLLVLGWPILGGWFPYIGFTQFYNFEDKTTEKCFLIEWFCTGVAFTGKDDDE